MTLASDAAQVRDALSSTVSWITREQEHSGFIAWQRGGTGDPWNHVEAAMALAVGGELDAAWRAYRWLKAHQLNDGSWCASYRADGAIAESHVDTNATAYVATGAYHLYVATKDEMVRDELFDVVERALDFVCAQAFESGVVPWALDPHGLPASYGLVAAASSLYASLRAGVALAHSCGERRATWSNTAQSLRGALARGDGAFRPKDAFAMDWYYPVLAGVLAGASAHERLVEGAPRFVSSRGVLCRSDQRWVTTAETAECAIAHLRAGRAEAADRLLCALDVLRDEDGSYRTGIVYPEESEFPKGERTTYSAASVVLAYDAACGGEVCRALGF